MSERETFNEIVDGCPVDPVTNTCEWVKWVRDEGYDSRMHGGVLHAMIIDKIVSYTDQQNMKETEETLVDRLRDRAHCNDFYLRNLAADEIDRLKNIIDTNPDINKEDEQA